MKETQPQNARKDKVCLRQTKRFGAKFTICEICKMPLFGIKILYNKQYIIYIK